DQDRRWRSFLLGDDVHQIVQAVIEVHVGDAGWTVQRRVARGGTRRGMAGGIALADVRFDLDDPARRLAFRRAVAQHLSEQLARDLERRPRVEVTRQDSGTLPHQRAVWSSRPDDRISWRY